METFQLYHRFEATVQPWLPDAPLTLGGLAVCSLCDGSSETSQVPAHLPRPAPAGSYRWGVFADESTLHVVLESREGPAIPDLADNETALEQLTFFAPDHRWYRTLQLEKEPRVGGGCYTHGPRKTEVPAGDWNWKVERRALGPGHWRTHWEVAMEDLTPLIRAGRLLASLSRSTYRTLEGVAWGSYGLWGPRADESGVFLFPDAKEEEPSSPLLHDLTVEIDPLTLDARFRTEWIAPFGPDELIPNHFNEPWKPLLWDQYGVRVNGETQMAPFSEPTPLPPQRLKPGFNEIHVAHRGGTAARLFLEVSEDRQISPLPDFIPSPPASLAHPHTWALEQLDALIAQRPVGWPGYGSWMSSLGTSVTLWLPHLPASKAAAWRQWALALGDLTLSYQREDGTFSGFHLSKDRRTPHRWHGGAYDSGPVGEFWVRLWQATGEPRFLDAAQRLLLAYQDYRIEFNQNYTAFALYHLAAQFEATGDPLALDHLRYYLRYPLTRAFLPLGFPGGHNAYTVYASIILRGLTCALDTLPANDPLRERTLDLARRMSNQTMTRLQRNGACDSRDRNSVGMNLWITGWFGMARHLSGTDRVRIDEVLSFVLNGAATDPAPEQPFPDGLSGRFASSLAASPAVARYLIDAIHA